MCAIKISVVLAIFQEVIETNFFFHVFAIDEPVALAVLFERSRWSTCV